MRVLLIDDQEESVQPLRDELSDRGFKPHICGFDEAQRTLLDWRPAAVVLDLLLGPAAEGKDVGTDIFGVIWETRFCPIVVYSAEPERLEDVDHPFVKSVQKGAGSEELACQALQALRPSAEGLREVAEYVDLELHQALRRVALSFGEEHEVERLTRAVLRQVAARLDTDRFGSPLLHPEERYVYPPVHTSLLTGDLLRSRDSDEEDPSGYRLVLTPSCDLVSTDEREPKVANVLVARCEAVTKITAKSSLQRVLREGREEELIVLPAFNGVLPGMAADLKSLELIPFESVALREEQDGEYERIASIDSPFREHVTWCYLQVTGRPGLPACDVSDWADELRKTRKELQEE